MSWYEGGILAICPFCEKEVKLPLQSGTVNNMRIYYCPHCKKILGVGYVR